MIAQNKDQPTRIVYSTYYRVHPEDRQKFIDAVTPHLAVEAQIPGVVYYVFAQDITDPNTFHLSEGFRDQAALDEHDRSPAFAEALRKVRDSVRILDRQGQRYVVASQGPGDPPGGVTLAQ
ncbi:antibiotic biosynthesis monooxygenase family protein [Streptomyces sp. NPDC048290]|uniref:putative quinol monooxygenase n=1 Tax=Streptomyces sp. NPDC048290 TaxID=3155811 RepID=UPI00342D20D5